MKLTQRKFTTSTEFEFLPQRLNYTFRTLSGSRQLAIDYADISFDTRRITERYSSYLYMGLVLFGVGGLLGAFIYETEQRFSGFNYAVFGLVLLVAYFVQRKEYLLLMAGNDLMMVLGDKKTEVILSEIDRARRTRFLELLRRPDFIEDEAKRRGLVIYLLERQVFSNQEAEDLLRGSDLEPPNSPRDRIVVH
jgi:hypothetical protein